MKSKQKLKKILITIVTGICVLPYQVVFSFQGETYQGYKHYFEEYGVRVDHTTGIDTTYPNRAKPDISQSITDLNHWVGVIPYQQDKNAKAYIVYPLHGVVVPIIQPTQKDLDKIKTGDPFDHFGYLQQGALHYFGNSPNKGNGNMIIAAHSSFKNDDEGRYKTVFQVLPISRQGEKIFVYIQNESSGYDFFEYVINDSFETHKHDTSILKQGSDQQTLTTYGCYIIGSNESRWVNTSSLMKRIVNHSTLGKSHNAPNTNKDETMHGNNNSASGTGIVSNKKQSQSAVFTQLTYRKIMKKITFNILQNMRFHRPTIQMFKQKLAERINETSQISNQTQKTVLLRMLYENLENNGY